MQLLHYTASALISVFLYQFGTERPLFRTLSQPQQTNKDVPLWILVREECLPASICGIITSQELNRLWANFVVDLVNLYNGLADKF